jgi:PAS domain S-box-containing protein
MNHSVLALIRALYPIVAVIAAYGVRIFLESHFGPGLPTYVTFYPVVTFVAIVSGMVPGLVATATSALVVYYFMLTPNNEFGVTTATEAIGMGIFVSVGMIMSLVATHYLQLRTRLNEMVIERTAKLTLVNAELQRECDQRQQAEAALAEISAKNRYLAELLESSEQPFAVADATGHLDYCNRAFESMTGYTQQELIATDWYAALTPPEWSLLERTQLAELRRTGHAVRYEKEYLRKDGSRVPVELLVHVMQNDDGSPTCYYSFITDLSQRKSAEETMHALNEGLIATNAELHQQTQELARSNEELRRAEERLRFHTENAPLAVIEWDADFIVTRWTGEAERMFGWSAAETVGKPITGLRMVYEDDLPLVEGTIKRLTSGSSPKIVANNRNYTKSGEIIHCVWYNTVLPDTTGKIISVMSLVQDVTEQMLADMEIARLNQNLQRSLDELEAIFQTAPVGLAIAEDSQGLHIRGNAANEQLFGISSGGNLSLALENPAYRVFSENRELNLLELPMQRAVRGETVSGQIIDALRQDGQLLHLFCNAVPLYDESGASRGAVGAFLDITEIKRSEERLKLLAETAGKLLETVSPKEEIEALCRKALEILDCDVFFNYLVDTDSGKLHLNASEGISAEEKEKIAWLDYGVAVCGCAARDACRIVVEDIPHSNDDRTDLVKGYGVKAYACHPLMTAGEVLGTLSFGTFSRTTFREDELDLMKAIAGLVAIAIERNKSKEKLEMARAMLENQVLERTVDLQEALRSLESEMNDRLQAVEALRQKERLLSQQSRLAAMGEMISNIAHQWRQPLNTLGLLIQQLPVFYGSDVFTREFLASNTTDAMKLIQHMSATIDDFRDFFRPEKEQTVFSVDKAIHQALSLVDVSFRNQNLSVDVLTEGNPVINGFPNEFSQVIMNIILNARDALLENGGENGIIHIRAGQTNDTVHITIRDNAGGIPEEIIDRIFEPYFTTKGPDRGTGIGLFMAKTIIEQNHGGRLHARNVQGGAEFRIEI